MLEKLVVQGGRRADHLILEYSRRMLADDTPEQQAKDREIIDAWYRAQGRDRAAEAEGAKERLVAMLEARSTSL